MNWKEIALLVVVISAAFPGITRTNPREFYDRYYQDREDGRALVLADVWIVAAMARDWRTRGAVHPVLAWAGTAVMLEQTIEALAYDRAAWRVAARRWWASTCRPMLWKP